MSEEEKKALEWFKEDLAKEKEECENYNEYKNQIIKRNEKLLKLIERLTRKKYIFNAETNELKEIPIDGNYISKDKIREYIKENKRIYEMKTPNRNRVVYEDCVLLTEEAKKLLEEN